MGIQAAIKLGAFLGAQTRHSISNTSLKQWFDPIVRIPPGPFSFLNPDGPQQKLWPRRVPRSSIGIVGR